MWYLSISHISFPESATAVILHRETFLSSYLWRAQLCVTRTATHSSFVFTFLTYSLDDCWYGWDQIFSAPCSLITTSLRENFALLGRTVLCVFTVVGRYCLRLTCVCLFSFYFSLFRHIYTFRHCFGFTLTSGVGCVFLSRCIFFNNPIFQIRDEFFKNGEFVAMDRVRTTSHFLVTPISLLVGVWLGVLLSWLTVNIGCDWRVFSRRVL